VQLAPPSSDRGNWFNATGVGERDLAGAVTLVAGAFRFEHRGEADDELLLVVPPPPRQGSALRVLLDKVLTRKDDEVVDVDVDVSKLLPGAITGKVTLRGADFPVGRSPWSPSTRVETCRVGATRWNRRPRDLGSWRAARVRSESRWSPASTRCTRSTWRPASCCS
jgi:hypothetical protein